jgi:hypothetical protein
MDRTHYRTTRTGRPGQDNQHKTLIKQDNHEGQDSQEKETRIGQLHSEQKKTVGISKLIKNNKKQEIISPTARMFCF